MITLIVSLLLATPSAQAKLTAADVKACAPDDIINAPLFRGLPSADENVDAHRFKFAGDELYRVLLPKSGKREVLPTAVFPELKDACFSIDDLEPNTNPDFNPTLMKNLREAEARSCAKSRAAAEKIEGDHLNEPLAGILAVYSHSIEVIENADRDLSGALEPGPFDQKNDGAYLKKLSERFASCESLTGENAALKEKIAQIAKKFRSTLVVFGQTPTQNERLPSSQNR